MGPERRDDVQVKLKPLKVIPNIVVPYCLSHIVHALLFLVPTPGQLLAKPCRTTTSRGQRNTISCLMFAFRSMPRSTPKYRSSTFQDGSLYRTPLAFVNSNLPWFEVFGRSEEVEKLACSHAPAVHVYVAY